MNSNLKSSTCILLVSVQMVVTACSRISNRESMRMELEHSSENRTEKKTEPKQRRDGKKNEITSSRTDRSKRSSIFLKNFQQERRPESENDEIENNTSVGVCERIIGCCCFYCIVKDGENTEEEEEESHHLVIREEEIINDTDNPLKPILDYAKSGQKVGYIVDVNESYKITITPNKSIPLKEETASWPNRLVPLKANNIYPEFYPVRKEPFSPPIDNRLLSLIKPLTCDELSDFLESKEKQLMAIQNFKHKRNIFKDGERVGNVEEKPEMGIIDKVLYWLSSDENKKNPDLTLEDLNDSEEISENQINITVNQRSNQYKNIFFTKELNAKKINNALKNEKAHYTLSLVSKKNRVLDGYSAPTLLEAITILQQDSLLTEPKLTDKKLYTTSEYTTGASSSKIAVQYNSNSRSYSFSLTNTKGTEKNITILSVQRIQKNPSERICCDECTSPIFCFGHCCIRPKYMCYICHSPPVYHCGKVKLKGLNCSINNWSWCYCPTLPFCLYPTSTTCVDRCGCLCCSACCCCLINSSTPFVERCGYYCCLCNPACSCGT